MSKRAHPGPAGEHVLCRLGPDPRGLAAGAGGTPSLGARRRLQDPGEVGGSFEGAEVAGVRNDAQFGIAQVGQQILAQDRFRLEPVVLARDDEDLEPLRELPEFTEITAR